MSTPVIHIRHAVADDAAQLASFGAKAFAETFGPENTPEDMAAYLAASFSPAQIAAELADPQTPYLIAEIDSALVGYAKLNFGVVPPEITAPSPIELVRIYSASEYLGKGVGAALMQACLDYASQHAFQTIWLGVWERNLRAQAFYRKWGFEVVGTHPFLLGTDLQTDFIMQRKL